MEAEHVAKAEAEAKAHQDGINTCTRLKEHTLKFV